MNKLVRFLAMPVVMLLWAACGEQDFLPEREDNSAVIHVSAAPMTIVGEQVPYCGTRAFQPLRPEYENSIYSLTVLIFDVAEGVLRHFPAEDGQRKLYKYMNLKNEHGDGLLNTTLPTEDFPVVAGTEYMVCLIANFSEEQVGEMISSMMDDGTVFFDEFKNYKVEMPYVLTPGEGEDEGLDAGHVRYIYMFGYYRGEVSSHDDITISLGRIISRLEIVFTFDESNLEKDKSLYVQLENLEQYAHLFPFGKSPGVYLEQGIYKVPTLDELKNSTIYLYAAPNSASEENDALCLNMWYVSGNLSLAEVGALEPNAVIHLCNDQPGVEDRNFQLNRNSVYRFNLNLTTKE